MTAPSDLPPIDASTDRGAAGDHRPAQHQLRPRSTRRWSTCARRAAPSPSAGCSPWSSSPRRRQSEDPIAAANAASFEHPCRVIVVARGSQARRRRGWTRRSGSAATPAPARWSCCGCTGRWSTTAPRWWCRCCWPTRRWSCGGRARRRSPGRGPDRHARRSAGSPTRSSAKRPVAQLAKRRDSYRPGDTDLAWTRITRWRGLLASTLDQPPHDKVTAATVAGAADSPSADLLAAWLALALRCPVKRVKSPTKSGSGPALGDARAAAAGDISLVRPQTITAELKVANQPERHVALPRRGLRDCLSEELRRLDADEVYAEVLTKGLPLVNASAAGPGRHRGRRAEDRQRQQAGTGEARSAAARSRKTAGQGARAGQARRRTAARDDPPHAATRTARPAQGRDRAAAERRRRRRGGPPRRRRSARRRAS